MRRRLIVIGFVAVALCAYARILNGWFLSDDTMIAALMHEGPVDWAHVRRTFVTDWIGRKSDGNFYRPIIIVSQAIDATVWRVNPLGYHLTNVVLHGVNAFLLYRVALLVGVTLWGAALTASLFLLHPWHPESVAWISGRTDVLATTFIIATLVLHADRHGDTRSRLGALLTCSLGLGSKEIAAVVPGLILVFTLGTEQAATTGLRRVRNALLSAVPYAALTAAYLALRRVAIGGAEAGPHAGFLKSWTERPTLGERLERVARMFATPFNRAETGEDQGAYVLGSAAVAVVLLLAFAWSCMRRTVHWRCAATALGLSVVALFPFASMLWIADDLSSSRFMYAATAWLCLTLGALASGAPRSMLAGALTVQIAVHTWLLQTNLTPWATSGNLMRELTLQYGPTFGAHAGEVIHGLPRTINGAYLALYNADIMRFPFVDAPPNLDAVASKQVRYSKSLRTLVIDDDPAHGAVDRWRSDLETSQWLWPLDGAALDAPDLKNIVALGRADDVRTFKARRPPSWLTFDAPRPPDPGANVLETAYLLIRPPPAEAPVIAWTTSRRKQFINGREAELRPDLVVRDGRLVAREVDGFVMYSEALDAVESWPGMHRVSRIRLKLHLTAQFEIRFFGIAQREAKGGS